MNIRKFRWSKTYESAEEELVGQLQAKSVATTRWVGEAHQDYPEQSLDYTIQLWCAEGSIIYQAGTSTIRLQAGDAVILPARQSFSAVAGMNGCICYQANL